MRSVFLPGSLPTLRRDLNDQGKCEAHQKHLAGLLYYRLFRNAMS